MSRIVCLLSLFIAVALVHADGISDSFTEKEKAGRALERGAWFVIDGQAACKSDPELYKKYSNHGPIVRWAHEFIEGTVAFEMKTKDCQRLVFTFNGDGHVFRVSLLDPEKTPGKKKKATSRIIMWATKSSKENKGDAIKPDGLPELAAMRGKWTTFKMSIEKDKGTLSIGDWSTTFSHAALAREKNSTTISFAQGYFAVRNFSLTTK